MYFQCKCEHKKHLFDEKTGKDFRQCSNGVNGNGFICETCKENCLSPKETETEICFLCDKEFPWDDNKSCYAGQTRLGDLILYCDDCAWHLGLKFPEENKIQLKKEETRIVRKDRDQFHVQGLKNGEWMMFCICDSLSGAKTKREDLMIFGLDGIIVE
jgi:hypothetical protein